MSDPTATPPHPDPDCDRIREFERRRIAKDLHDDLGSHLTAIKMALAQLSGQLPASAANRSVQAESLHIHRLIDDAIDAMHDIIDDLHPPVLDLGLRAGLEWLAKTFSSQTGVACHLVVGSDLPPTLLDSFQTVSLYRIAREALHNTAQHAAASRVEIHLRLADRRLTLDITDNGTGLPAHAGSLPETAGLRGMHTRATTIGAMLALSPATGGGTRVSVELPVLSDANPIK